MTDRELAQIYNEAYKPVYWTAMQLLKNEADAVDVVQDTFIAFIESYSDIKDTGKAVALLMETISFPFFFTTTQSSPLALVSFNA